MYDLWHYNKEGGRLSRSRHCSKGAQPVPKAVYRGDCRDKHDRPWWDSNLGFLAPQSSVLLLSCRGLLFAEITENKCIDDILTNSFHVAHAVVTIDSSHLTSSFSASWSSCSSPVGNKCILLPRLQWEHLGLNQRRKKSRRWLQI